MQPALTLNLASGQIIAVTLSSPAETRMLSEVAAALVAAQATAAVLTRTYHMGSKPTAGRGYDDRLTARLGIAASTCYKYLDLGEHAGGIRARQAGNKWIVSEAAVREWLGETQ